MSFNKSIPCTFCHRYEQATSKTIDECDIHHTLVRAISLVINQTSDMAAAETPPAVAKEKPYERRKKNKRMQNPLLTMAPSDPMHGASLAIVTLLPTDEKYCYSCLFSFHIPTFLPTAELSDQGKRIQIDAPPPSLIRMMRKEQKKMRKSRSCLQFWLHINHRIAKYMTFLNPGGMWAGSCRVYTNQTERLRELRFGRTTTNDADGVIHSFSRNWVFCQTKNNHISSEGGWFYCDESHNKNITLYVRKCEVVRRTNKYQSFQAGRKYAYFTMKAIPL